MRFLGLVFLVLSFGSAYAQNFVFQSVSIEGNRLTKPFVILNELPNQVGDTLNSEAFSEFQKAAEERLDNLGLFRQVECQISGLDSLNYFDVKVIVEERQYHIPIPVVTLADRNFNEWVELHGAAANRLLLGAFYFKNNVGGRNHSLKLGVLGGFAQRAVVDYSVNRFKFLPSLGLDVFADIERNRRVSVGTDSNELLYVEEDEFVRNVFTTGGELTYHLNYSQRFHLGLYYDYQKFTGNPELNVNAPQLNLRYVIDQRDRHISPSKGFRASLELVQKGYSPSTSFQEFYGSVSYFIPFLAKVVFATQANIKWSTNHQNQRFSNQEALGYEEFWVRGLETKVIGGPDYLLLKGEFKFPLFDFVLESPFENKSVFADMPVELIPVVFMDFGRATIGHHMIADYLSDQNLMSTGLGLNVILYENIQLRIEYAFTNQQGYLSHGIGFHTGLSFQDYLHRPVRK